MKGISPFIAAAIVIAIVISAGIILSNWFSLIVGEQTDAVSNRTAECRVEGMSIDSVYIDASSGRARISVKNSGLAPESIISAVVISKSGSGSSNLTAFPISLPLGAVRNIELNVSGNITACSDFSEAIVSSGCSRDVFKGAASC